MQWNRNSKKTVDHLTNDDHEKGECKMKHCFPTTMRAFYPSNEFFRNPHKGFTTFQRYRGDVLNENWTVETGWMMEKIPEEKQLFCGKYTDGYPDTSICYFRIPWRVLEPEKGVYDFSFLDEVLRTAEEREQHVMLRFPPHAARPGSLDLPEWMQKALNLPPRTIGDKNSPDHPLYYQSYGNLIRAIGARIDGDPRVTAVDMALISAWGEGAQIHSVKEENWKSLVDAYMQSFTQTPISALYNHLPSIQYANTYRPVGFRADCLGNMDYHMNVSYPPAFAEMNDLWEKAPIAFEVCWTMQHWVTKGWDIDFIMEQALKWHITSFNAKSARIPNMLKEKNKKWIKRMGYRFALRTIEYPESACPGDILHFSVCMENSGVAPIYHRYPFVLRLRNDHIVVDLPTDADITAWLPGDHLWRGTVALPPDIPCGEYVLEAGITDGKTIVHIATDAPKHQGFVQVGERVTIDKKTRK